MEEFGKCFLDGVHMEEIGRVISSFSPDQPRGISPKIGGSLGR
jgi:hypothetical protein